jgi:crotonobetainyl-CoA:carnitine CoA-transferase CaiB-like acyl-CoA transferase
MSGPLTGLRVVDVSIMAAGPWVGVLLGQLGAEVIKVEPPTGDGTRWVEPQQHGMGTNFMCMNLNKQDIVLDLKNADDRSRALDLCAGADVFVQNYRGGVIERLGLGYEALRERNPGIVYCSVSGFGENGPLAKEACADFIMQAYSGFARLNGQPGDELEAFRFSGFIDLTTSIVSMERIRAARGRPPTTGVGQKLEVSMLQAALEMQYTRMAELLGADSVFHTLGSQSPGLVPDRAYPTLDGMEVFATAHTPAQWLGFCAAIGMPELAQDARFASNALRVRHRTEFDAITEPVMAARPSIWWMRAFERQRVPCALPHNFEQFRYHVQVRDNGMVADVDTPAWGRVVVAGLPWHFSRTAGAVLPPPVPGADTERVLGELVQPRAKAAEQPAVAGTAPELQGLRVVELASGVAGPMATCRLGDLGAEVIKVEWGEGDWMRACPPTLPDGTGAAWFALNRGKRSLRIDPADPESLQVLRRLVEDADVLVTDLTTQGLSEVGLAGADADRCAWNPRLIVAQLSAFGKRGPWAEKAGSELCAQAMAGYTRYVGTQGRPGVRLGADVAGCATAIFATQAVLAALLARAQNGDGQRVDLSLLNSLLAMKTVHLAAQSDPDIYEGPRVGGAYDPPERGWATADVPITFAFGGAVGAEGRPGWTQFVESVGLAHLLDDPRFDKSGRRTTGLGPKAREYRGEYEVGFASRPSAQIVARVRELGGLASAYLTHQQLMAEPQVQAQGVVQHVMAASGQVRALAFPVKFSDGKPVLRERAPALGEHTSSITAEVGRAPPSKS